MREYRVMILINKGDRNAYTAPVFIMTDSTENAIAYALTRGNRRITKTVDVVSVAIRKSCTTWENIQF